MHFRVPIGPVRPAITAAAIVVSLAPAVCRAQTPAWFITVRSDIYPMRLSGDGRWAVGYRYGPGFVKEAVRWNIETREVQVLPITEPGDAQAMDANRDGSIITGRVRGAGVIWRAGSADELLGPLPPETGVYPVAISSDGRVIAGRFDIPEGSMIFRWVDPQVGGAGVQPLGELPGGYIHAMVTGMSQDGRVICGASLTADGREAFRWIDPGTGGDGLISLGDLPGGRIEALAMATSSDGSVIVGQGGVAPTGFAEAFRWLDPAGGGPGMVGMGVGTNEAAAVSATGNLIAGSERSGGGDPQAFIWTAALQRADLRQWLLDHGVADVEPWSLYAVLDASDDGRTILGYGARPGSAAFAWVARLGRAICPADLNEDNVVDFTDYLEFLNLYDRGDPAVDFNGDGLVDFSDYLEFLNLYEAGC